MDEYSHLLEQIKQLNESLPSEYHSEGLIYEMRLRENIDKSRRYGDNPTRRSERAEILAQVNRLSLNILNQPFSLTIDNTLSEQSTNSQSNADVNAPDKHETRFAKWLDKFDKFIEWSTADEHSNTSWEGRFLHSFSVLIKKITWQRTLKFACILLILWLTATFISPLYQWDTLGDEPTRRIACLQYIVGYLLAPFLLTWVVPTPTFVSIVQDSRRDKFNLFLLKLAGSYTGFFTTSISFFSISVIDILTPKQPFSIWVYNISLFLALLFAYIVARRIPANRHKMFGEKPTLHTADKLFLIVSFSIGIGVAAFLYWFYEFFTTPVTVLLLPIMLISAMYWEQSGKKKSPFKQLLELILISSLVSIIIVGISLFLFAQENDPPSLSEIFFLLQIIFYLLGMFVMYSCVMLWHSLIISRKGILAFMGCVIIPFFIVAYAPLDLQVQGVSWVIIISLWSGWGRRYFREYWWIPPMFSLQYIVSLGAFALVLAGIRPIFTTPLYLLLTGSLLYWAYTSSDIVNAARQGKTEINTDVA